MELKIGDLVKHFSNGNYGIVMSKPHEWRDCKVCKVRWCFIDRENLIDVDFLTKQSGHDT